MILRLVAKYLLWFFLIPTAWSHPYDDPFAFRKHLTDDGRVIYSNIEKRCFSKGVLTCMEYHPIWKGRLKVATSKQDVKTGKQSNSVSAVTDSEE